MAKNKTKLLIIKNSCYKARANYQLPFYLCYLIYQLDGNEEVNYIKYLIEMTKHCLRVKGYYKQYPFAEKETENMIKDGLFKLGYTVKVVKAQS